jgi:TRAP-type C4-dicarboxylate transport system substrate-binding protein
LLYLTKKLFHSLPFHVLDGHAIFPGAATVSADFFPGLAQNVRPEYAVIERMEPTVPVPLGRQV